MGVYLNPNNVIFSQVIHSKIYVDKTGLISHTNSVLGTSQRNICVSRPRRFGKSTTVGMLVAYYSKGCQSSSLFEHFSIAKGEEEKTLYRKNLNQYDVIALNIQDFWSNNQQVESMVELISQRIIRELRKQYPNVDYFDETDLVEVLKNIHSELGNQFIFIIDEWDCIFRENKNSFNTHKKYLDFLRNLLKDKGYVALTYMTGILPIKKYGTHSALNMFDEYSMTDPMELTEYVGFTETEVKELCKQYQRDFNTIQEWYDGYCFDHHVHIYNPKSVVDAIRRGRYQSYWTRTETYEALKIYVDMNFDGLKEAILLMLAFW